MGRSVRGERVTVAPDLRAARYPGSVHLRASVVRPERGAGEVEPAG